MKKVEVLEFCFNGDFNCFVISVKIFILMNVFNREVY